MKWYNLMSLPVVERSFVEENAAVAEVEVTGSCSMQLGMSVHVPSSESTPIVIIIAIRAPLSADLPPCISQEGHAQRARREQTSLHSSGYRVAVGIAGMSLSNVVL